jgi:hypothetical protein
MLCPYFLKGLITTKYFKDFFDTPLAVGKITEAEWPALTPDRTMFCPYNPALSGAETQQHQDTVSLLHSKKKLKKCLTRKMAFAIH